MLVGDNAGTYLAPGNHRGNAGVLLGSNWAHVDGHVQWYRAAELTVSVGAQYGYQFDYRFPATPDK